MLQGHSSVFQALLGTFFTWGMTAAGAALVFVFSSGQRRILDGSLGFAAGVMLAASYWSLLAPAVEMATSSGGFGAFAFFPVAVGFTLGAAFVYLADLLMPHLGAAEDPQTTLALNFGSTLMKKKSDPEGPALLFPESELSIRIGRAGLLSDKSENGEAYQRKKAAATGLPEGPAVPVPSRGNLAQPGGSSWRRIALLILAITIHNVPGACPHLEECTLQIPLQVSKELQDRRDCHSLGLSDKNLSRLDWKLSHGSSGLTFRVKMIGPFRLDKRRHR
ncbi:zinc transporter ZIP11 isoform X9 [Homo sapiens]|uniref:zinc transporter ZIP11 isoform X9 n=1 Tax=Homo sapiens TaxID=9606 RepID=UPI0005D03D67|nr:zinc transporter ZIP11 isoform X9 [Homo sapiens]|eukprot:XP_011522798.1 zinc transporter ZIP11 isoform X8 [Homo sapiens]